MSESEEIEKSEREASLPLANIETVILVLDSILAKGGHCARDVLKTTVGKGEAMLSWAVSTAIELGLVVYQGKEYSLSPTGNKFSAQNENDRKRTMCEIILSYQPYHTILLRLKNSPDNSLSKTDITKAWFELTKEGSEPTRSRYTSAFASICEWCGIIDNRKKTVGLTSEGVALLSGTHLPTAEPSQIYEPTKAEKEVEKIESSTSPLSIHTQAQLNTMITINLTVDTKDLTSVENMLKIIRAVRGEDANRTA